MTQVFNVVPATVTLRFPQKIRLPITDVLTIEQSKHLKWLNSSLILASNIPPLLLPAFTYTI